MKDKFKEINFLRDLQKLFHLYGVELIQIPCCDELVISEVGKYRFESYVDIEINKDLITILRHIK